mmetsp:Transcript_25377/g.55432  ORF Transcript_25377/g.55432 Transcript_25377/m.55432 type:complete len:85 (+) Transcript_25377:1369-1623(+)
MERMQKRAEECQLWEPSLWLWLFQRARETSQMAGWHIGVTKEEVEMVLQSTRWPLWSVWSQALCIRPRAYWWVNVGQESCMRSV